MTADTDQKPLTARQREVFDWIAGFVDVHGYSPTVREVAHAYGWSTNGAVCHLRAIRRKGWLTWERHQSRTMRPIAEEVLS